jgi:hypothetical protein
MIIVLTRFLVVIVIVLTGFHGITPWKHVRNITITPWNLVRNIAITPWKLERTITITPWHSHDISEIFLKVALKHQNQNQIHGIMVIVLTSFHGVMVIVFTSSSHGVMIIVLTRFLVVIVIVLTGFHGEGIL